MPGYHLNNYSNTLLDHFENPRNAGTLDNADAVGSSSNPACGDRLELSLRVRDGRIADVRFRASGCTAAIAGSSMTTVLLKGKTLEEAGKVRDSDVAEALGGLPPAKIHCSLLAEEAIHAVLADLLQRESLET